jgi:hypothetical protein
MALAEYLYIDRTRLDSYFQQLSSPTAFEKVPSWKVSLSLAGPGVEGAQSQFARPYTDHEKIKAVLDHLHASSNIRPPEFNSCPTFVFESLDAIPVRIPIQPGTTLGRDAITLWVAEPKDINGGYRFLIENFAPSDAEPSPISSFSCLQILLDECGESIGDFFSRNVDQYALDVPHDQVITSTGGAFEGLLPLSQRTLDAISITLTLAKIPPDSFRVIGCLPYENEQHFWVAIGDRRYRLQYRGQAATVSRQPRTELSTMLAAKPISLLSSWGAKIGTKREIDALYRVRQSLKEARVLPRDRITTVGYPIFLVAHPSPFTQEYRINSGREG